MDAPFPPGMIADIEKFFREVHPELAPGQDLYDEVYATAHFFPLQRKREARRMVQIARRAGPRCAACGGTGTAEDFSKVPEGLTTDCGACGGCGFAGPTTVMEIGTDKGGSLYHWCQCLPTVRNVIACEIRGTPYRHEFEQAFPKIEFCWTLASKTDHGEVLHWLKAKAKKIGAEITEQISGMTIADVNSLPAREPIDVLFIDGDKNSMLSDFVTYLPHMRKPGGVVFIHDVQDREPCAQFNEVQRMGFRTNAIIDVSEYVEFADSGREPATPWEGWLAHWRGRSCGVGVVYV